MKMEELIKSRVHQAGLAGWQGEFLGYGRAWVFCSWLFDRPLVSEGFLCSFL